VLAREPVLVGLASSEEAIFAHAIVEGLSDRVSEQHETDRVAVPGGIPPGLVEALGVPEPKSVPGGDRPVVQLHDPEPEPAPGEGDGRELSMEVLSAACEGFVLQLVQVEESLEVLLEPVRVGEPEAKVVLAGELAL